MPEPTWLNKTRAATIQVPCLLCRGLNPNCRMCDGGTVTKKACMRCGGTAKDGGAKCVDCQGQGYRAIDNERI